MGATIFLTVKNARDELQRITAAVESLGQRDDWPEDLVFRVNLVLEELGLNIMDYGHVDSTDEIAIAVTSEGGSVTIEVVDGGRPFDPLNDAPAPDLTSPIEDRRVGGLGLYLVRNLMDEVSYRRESGKNRLTMVTRKAR